MDGAMINTNPGLAVAILVVAVGWAIACGAICLREQRAEESKH